jgi:predicted transcriptional regulator with HTH domain
MTRSLNKTKLNRIVSILKNYPQGIWIRELARRANLDRSLVSRYVNLYLRDKIEDVYPTRKPIRIIKLK